MPTTASTPRRSTARPARKRRGSSEVQLAEIASPGARCKRRGHDAPFEGPIARYHDHRGRRRELVRRAGAGGSVLVLDCDSVDRCDRRLVAHLAADEPQANAELVCAMYLADAQPPRCRRLAADDMRTPMPTELEGQTCVPLRDEPHRELSDATGDSYRLMAAAARTTIPQLRWCKICASEPDIPRPLSVRDVIGALECYEPVRSSSADAVRRHRDDGLLSVATLAVELERLGSSRIVLNRGLREAVLAAVEGSDLSLSEIALRCGRVKRDSRGRLSGETTWLSRRIGHACGGGAEQPTPWIHSDVLALIARRGLGIAPREVELA
jgi:hypothetical protein